MDEAEVNRVDKERVRQACSDDGEAVGFVAETFKDIDASAAKARVSRLYLPFALSLSFAL